MYQKLHTYIQNLEAGISEIPDDRRKKLKSLANFIRTKNPAKLLFICTHNSRRSHLCQIWAATMAELFGLESIETFSGGTEVTAFNPRAVAAIKRAGFCVAVDDPGGTNPHYKVYPDEQSDPLICFSKTFDDPANPKEDFAAIMTCSEADQNCPVVPGASHRVSIPYEDPQKADGTSREAEIYDERCRQIAVEMYQLMSKI